MSEQLHDDDQHEHTRVHDRRYRIFAAVLATTILFFAAISITVVVLAP
ncbi:MAG: hypothetical protein NTX29_14915 [Actinobacteria bacterium]|nr:hypothetical protein [Actinomycetota bacterium]